MSLLPCPSCGLPRTADDLASLDCPLCGHRELPPDEPIAVAEPIAVPVAPPPQRASLALFVGLCCLAVVGVLTVAVLDSLRQPRPVATTEEPRPSVAVATPSIVVALLPELAPTPRYVLELAPNPRVYVAVLETVARPRAIVAPLDGAKVIAIDRPKGSYELPVLRNRAQVQLVGRVDRLVILGVEDGSSLDALTLSAREVVFAGKIDGGSTARVRTTNGAISFLGKVDGASDVVAEAPLGTVTFLSQSSARFAEPTIDGGSQVTVAARLVVIEKVMGADTRVDVTLHPTPTAPSFLRVGLIDGPSMVRYRNVAGSKGKPTVLPGELRGGAVLKQDK